MKSLNLEEIIKCIDGERLTGPYDFEINHVITKPEKLNTGTMFFNMDNGSFNKLILERPHHNTAVVTSNIPGPGELSEKITLIKVPDINKAFWKFVDFYRGFFKIPVIGVTGTNGKTTTKEMIRHILSEKYNILSTYRSRNSLSSNLKYLLNMDDTIDAGVFEMPVYCPGSLLKACKFLKPCAGIITNIGIDHIEGCRTPESYIKAKAEFLEGLGPQGTIILNCDDSNIKKIGLDSYKGNIVYFGLCEESDFRAFNIIYTNNGTRFVLRYKNKDYRVFIPAFGEFNVLNALASVAAVYSIGIDIQFAIDRLFSFKNIEGHFEFHKGINGSTVIDDTWNTNPSSAEAALNLFSKLSNGKETIAALGRMTLLGKYSDKYHIKIGERIVQLGIGKLITMDEESKMIGTGALKAGKHPHDVYFCKGKEEVYSILKKLLNPDSIVLLKATLEDCYSDLIDRITIDN